MRGGRAGRGGAPDCAHATQDEFLSNLSTASKALQKVLPEVLDYVTGKSVSEL